MAMLKHQKHEQFAQRIAGGLKIGEAYREAGYTGHISSATIRFAETIEPN